ncbi:MAG: maleylacetoacetate isomerase [Alphaproteobacteria bacterium]|nr:maleylacetoacetate isomerase [Alphaproteobacteria bacterium]
MKLYGYWRSSSAWRVRLGLHLKGLPFTYVPVHLVQAEQRADAHRARNPMAQVPVLEVEVDGRPVHLSQSLAILAWLDEAFPEAPPLLPDAALDRARARQYAEVVNAGIQPLQNLAVLQQIEALGGDRQAWGRQVIADGLRALEAMVAGPGVTYMVGDRPTVADVCLVPQLYNARRFDVALDAYPTLLAIEARCAALPAFVAAHPDQQPDAPAA